MPRRCALKVELSAGKKSAHGDVNIGAFADNGVEDRAADCTVEVMRHCTAIDQAGILAFGKPESLSPDAGQGLKADPVVRRQLEQ